MRSPFPHMCWPVLLVALLVIASPLCAAVKIGVFPLQYNGELDGQFISEPLLASLNESVLQDLLDAGFGEVVPLPWDVNMEEGTRPTFETLVEIGKSVGCSGVLLLQVKSLTFTAEEREVPLVGAVLSGKAAVQLAGGLIDVQTAAGVAPVEVQASKNQSPLKGLTPDDEIDFDSRDFADSLPGKVLVDACRKLAAAVKDGIPRLTPGTVLPPRRPRTPEGVGFTETSFAMRVSSGYDRRGIVAVVNRGDAPQTFVIKPLAAVPEIVLGLVGHGSIDSPCTLGPGQWKYVRVLANIDAVSGTHEVRLGLFASPEGEEPDLQAPSHDTATLTLMVSATPPRVKFAILSHDPLTLTYTCRLSNPGEELGSYAVKPQPGQERMVEINPSLDTHLFLPRHGSIIFTVTPVFPAGAREMDITLVGQDDDSPDARLPLHFAIPAGKRLFYGLGHTSSSAGFGGSYCTNQGGIDYKTPKKFKLSERMQKSMDRDTAIKEQGNTKWRKSVEDGSYRDHTRNTPNPPPHVDRSREGGYDASYGGPRGGVIRPVYAARVPGLELDSHEYPMQAITGDRIGMVSHVPEDSRQSILFVNVPYDENEDLAFDLLNEEGHHARWPYICADYPRARAFAVWEDATGGKSDVAFAASTEKMEEWLPVQYLTTHAAGVDDPVARYAPDNRLVVAWNDLRSGSGQIYLRFSIDGGNTFAREVAIPRRPGETQAWPQVAFLPGDAGVMLVYVSATGDNRRIQALQLAADGAPVGEAVTLSTPGASCGEPQLVCLADGGGYAVWREGEGAASEIAIAARSLRGWDAPRRVTADAAYSEYPSVGVDAEGLWVGYHSDISGNMDLRYLRRGTDNGATWGEAVAGPARVPVKRAWLEANFSLAAAVSDYAPFTTRLLVNGREVGVLKDMMPDGTYLFEVPADCVSGNAGRLYGNAVEIRAEVANEAHFILLSQARLIAQWECSQVAVVAGSQAEADQLAAEISVTRNHRLPDLVLAANRMPILPTRLESGTPFNLNYQLHNIGEATATQTRVILYADDENGDLGIRKSTFAEKAVGQLAPGEVKEVAFSLKFDPARMPRICAKILLAETDDYPADNAWAISLTDGWSQEAPPTVGTDIPNIFRTPALLDMVDIPNLPAFLSFISLPNVGDILGIPDLPSLPSLRDTLNLPIDLPFP